METYTSISRVKKKRQFQPWQVGNIKDAKTWYNYFLKKKHLAHRLTPMFDTLCFTFTHYLDGLDMS